MKEAREDKPATVSRRVSVVIGFCRTTKRYDRARKKLDRHPNDILAAHMAFGT